MMFVLDLQVAIDFGSASLNLEIVVNWFAGLGRVLGLTLTLALGSALAFAHCETLGLVEFDGLFRAGSLDLVRYWCLDWLIRKTNVKDCSCFYIGGYFSTC
jgi:hypothetical protein